jgi:hypothetical protein
MFRLKKLDEYEPKNAMKVIIAGSRELTTLSFIEDAIQKSGLDIGTIISGNARGVDKLGIVYALKNNLPYEIFNAEWDVHGRSAGYKRNWDMARAADALIAIWDGKSKGTKHMIETMIGCGKRTMIYIPNGLVIIKNYDENNKRLEIDGKKYGLEIQN